MTTRTIQETLKNAGFDPGPIDGVRGRLTIRAIRAFQTARGLKADGIVGPLTRAALFPNGVPRPSARPYDALGNLSELPWFDEARNLRGLREVAGRGSNDTLMEMARNLELDRVFTHDGIPWCGLFVAHCIGSQLPEEVLPRIALRARAWEAFGVPTTPRLGAVMVFWRGNPGVGTGHVGFYWGEDKRAYHILGGNQSDAVTIARCSKTRFVTARWPSTGLAPATSSRILDDRGQPLSTNEA